MMFSLNEQQKVWNRALGYLSCVDIEPEEEILAFLNRGITYLGVQGLDIGCGLGRHTLVASKLGFKITAIDFSKLATFETSELVKSHGLQANILVASIGNLPFKEGVFDFSFSWCVLNHGTRHLFERALIESIRVLRPGGSSFGFIMSRNDPRYGCGVQFGEDCFVFTEGIEIGILHYFPSRNVLESTLQRIGHIKKIQEVRYEGNGLRSYHPKANFSCHFAFEVQKFF